MFKTSYLVGRDHYSHVSVIRHADIDLATALFMVGDEEVILQDNRYLSPEQLLQRSGVNLLSKRSLIH